MAEEEAIVTALAETGVECDKERQEPPEAERCGEETPLLLPECLEGALPAHTLI